MTDIGNLIEGVIWNDAWFDHLPYMDDREHAWEIWCKRSILSAWYRNLLVDALEFLFQRELGSRFDTTVFGQPAQIVYGELGPELAITILRADGPAVTVLLTNEGMHFRTIIDGYGWRDALEWEAEEAAR